MGKNKPVALFGILNWGLGHATRCIPLIDDFLLKNYDVVVCTNGIAFRFLEQLTLDIKLIEFGSFSIKYSTHNFLQPLKMAIQIPKFIAEINHDKKQIDFLVKKYAPNIIVSDNRYGFYHPKIKTVIVTHQINVPFNLFKTLGQKIVYCWLNKFNEIWVPDNKTGFKLSGELSSYPTLLKEKITCIGIQSALAKHKNIYTTIEYDVLLLLSGPEPQKTVFKNLIIKCLEKLDLKIAVVGTSKPFKNNQIINLGYLSGEKLAQIILKSKKVVCRSGYSTIMDLWVLQKQAILVPTPGQNEQLYLAKYVSAQPLFTEVNQKKIMQKLPDLVYSLNQHHNRIFE